ncbi:MAG: hypothetical protein NVSMB3_09400 [Acidobacteriaceae bacterium]
MDNRALIPLLVLLAVVVVVAVVLLMRRRNSAQLKERFGPEYERTVREHGDAGKAETVLAERTKRVEHMKIRELASPDRERYAQDWAGVQRQFVDDPPGAVTEADQLVTKVMSARGYPMGDFEQRAADVSVSYPAVVQNYRAARQIVVRHSKGQSSTEDLRQAMVHYRSLFDELLGSTAGKEIHHG